MGGQRRRDHTAHFSCAVDRADSANLGQSMPANLLEWSKNTLYYFDDKLRGVKQRLEQRSASNPAAFTYGGTSFVTRESPPMNA